MFDFFHHVDAVTGRINRTRGMDIPDAEVHAACDLLDAALLGGSPRLPEGYAGLILEADFNRRGLIATLWRGPDRPIIPVATIAVAPVQELSRFVWVAFHATSRARKGPAPEPVPEAPWASVRPEMGSASHPDGLAAAWRFSRVLALAWLDYDRRF
jgi:hypothetical protein